MNGQAEALNAGLDMVEQALPNGRLHDAEDPLDQAKNLRHVDWPPMPRAAGNGDEGVPRADSDALARETDGLPEATTGEKIAACLSHIYRAASSAPCRDYIRRQCRELELLVAELGSR